MKKALTILMPLLLIVACAVGSVNAEAKQRSGPPGKQRMRGPGGELGIPHGSWWKRGTIQEQIKLTNKQIEQLETIARQGRKQMVKLHAELELLNIDLEPIVDAKTFDRKAAESVLEKMEAVRAKMARHRIDMLLDMREILSQAQYLKLKELRGGRRRANAAPRAQGKRTRRADNRQRAR